MKAAAMAAGVNSLMYAVCARNEIVNLPEGTLAVTASDIFAT